MSLSIVSWPFLTGLAVAVLASVVVAARLRRHSWRRKMGAGGSLVLVLGLAAALVNAWFSYLPTLGDLFGHRAADAATIAYVRHLEHLAAYGPPPTLHGVVEVVPIPGTVSHFHARPAQVYLPPIFFTSPRPALPVIVLLHGTPGTPEDWTRAGDADVTADRWAVAHHGQAPIIIMADENGGFLRDTECVDAHRRNAETYLTVDVPAWAISRLGASADRRSWVIGGSSEGGYCALDIGVRHSDRFGTFLDFSGLDRPTYHGGTAHLFRTPTDRNAHTPRSYLRRSGPAFPVAAWFEVGASDGGTTRAVRHAADLARARGVDVTIVYVPGAHHTWTLWRRCFADAFPWTARRVGLD